MNRLVLKNLFIVTVLSVLIEPTVADSIEWFSLSPEDIPLKWEQPGQTLYVKEDEDPSTSQQYFFSIQGRVTDPDYTFLLNRKRLPVDANGNFKIGIPVREEIFSHDLLGINPLGEVSTQKIGIVIHDFEKLKASANRKPKATHRASLWVGGEFGKTHFNATNGASSDKLSPSLLLTGSLPFKLLRNYIHSPYINSEIRIAPLGTRYIRADARLSGQMLRWQESWALILDLGVVYTEATKSSSPNASFSSLGPELFPTLRKNFANQSRAELQLKFNPLGASAGNGTGFSNREFVAGISYQIAPAQTGFLKNHPIRYVINYNNLKIKRDLTEVNLTWTGFGAQVRF